MHTFFRLNACVYTGPKAQKYPGNLFAFLLYRAVKRRLAFQIARLKISLLLK